MTKKKGETTGTGKEIAVIGMAGRFPGAGNLDEFWDNLKNGVESISFLLDRELEKAGVHTRLITHPGYVKANAALEDKDYFDAGFFGFTPLEAELMNPQMRIFHECAWEALEGAGYDPGLYDELIGFYAGAATSSYWEALAHFSGKLDELGRYAALNLADKDFINTRISYNLNLKGPTFSVHTACSTSLVAIHLACRGLLTGECKMALAGGISIATDAKQGYGYREGMILSPDGHCRAFDAKAKGTIVGEGMGLVVLKRLKNAIEDGDCIHAIIKGSAINNDGNRKVGYTAPSVEAQAEVIRAAQRIAGVEPETIGYIETHGTGTTLGDPVEIEALTLAFNTGKRKFCAVGSVKTNIGHLDVAAGVTGFIKTVQVLKHRLIPPSLHFETPNPGIDFENSPFYVNTGLKEYKGNGGPLRAGVSSLGIGGTNAHVVLEEAPVMSYGSLVNGETRREREYQLILLSAKTESALARAAKNLGEYFKQNPGIDLADAAYTLQVGRRPLPYRRMFVCSTMNQAVEALTADSPGVLHAFYTKMEDRPIIFMFPGQGAQYVNMGWDLYRTKPVFREEMDRCFEILTPIMGCDIKEILYPHPDCRGGSPCPPKDCVGLPLQPDRINQTEIAQPLLFAFEYALAKLLMKWGITPDAMIGHSIGEYTAACLAGVFSLEDTLRLVVLRGQLMQQMPSGAMLGVPLTEDDLKPLLAGELSLAAVNSPSHCVVSGSPEAIAAFEKQLDEKGYECRRLHTSHAFHSKMMDPLLETFAGKVREVQLNKPQMSYISNVTGSWINGVETVDPHYWARQLRGTVRFSRGLENLLTDDNPLFLEVGPGKVLSTFVRQQTGNRKTHTGINLVRHPNETVADDCYLTEKIGQIWLYGVKIDWGEWNAGEKKFRVPLPTYPFEGQRYWIDGNHFNVGLEKLSQKSRLNKKNKLADWFYVPLWEPSLPASPGAGEVLEKRTWLVFTGECGLDSPLVNTLKKQQDQVIEVKMGPGFSKRGQGEFEINPRQADDYQKLIDELCESKTIPQFIVHLWGMTGDNRAPLDGETFEKAQYYGLYSLIYLVRAIGKKNLATDFKMTVVSTHLQDVTGEERLCPEKSPVLAAVNVIPQEYANIRCRSIDVDLPGPGTWREEKLIGQLIAEMTATSPDTLIAYRNNRRWVQTFHAMKLAENGAPKLPLRRSGVYLVTGGTGNIGVVLAEYLAGSAGARLILTGRSPLPEKKLWDQWLSSHRQGDRVSQKIRKLQEIESLGGEVMCCRADVADYEQMRDVIQRAEQRFGPVNGVVHVAGVITGKSSQCALEDLSEAEFDEQFHSKVMGLLVLEKLFLHRALDFCLLTSSLSSVLGGLGFTAYSAANAFMDAFVKQYGRAHPPGWISVNWDAWQLEEGDDSHGELGITPAEGKEVFQRVLAWGEAPQVVVSTTHLQARLDRWIRHEIPPPEDNRGTEELSTLHARPHITTPYVSHRTPREEALTHLWQKFFGIEKIGILDDFFELGGDSLMAMTVVSKIHKELKVNLPLAEFFNRSTIQKLAEYITHAERSAYSSIEPVEKKEYYPLSSAQKRLYIMHQMAPQSTAYHISPTAVLEGELVIDKFEDVFKRLITRHESYRTSFEIIEDEPVQRIHEAVEFKIEYYSAASGEPGGEAPSPPDEASGIAPLSVGGFDVTGIINNFIRPFDLLKAPLFRVGLVKIGPGKHLFMVDTNHIITDGISSAVLVTEFGALYQGKKLPPLKIQYKDYFQWQNRKTNTEKTKSQEKYWLREFEGEVPLLVLPVDYPRPVVQRFEGDKLSFIVNEEETQKLRNTAVTGGGTLYMVLLSIFYVLLYKLSSQGDIVVGAPTAGRRHAEVQNIIGVFLNTLALRCFPGGGKTFKTFCSEVKEKVLKAFENQEYPFEDLIDRLEVKKDTSRNPLFDVIFLLQNMKIPELHMPMLQSKPLAQKSRTSLFDLGLIAREQNHQLVCSFEFSTNLFKDETVEIFIAYFKSILSAVVDNPGLTLSEIPIIPEEKKAILLSHLNMDLEPEAMGAGTHVTFQDKLNENLNKSNNHIAIEYGNQHLTYAELHRLSNGIASWLADNGTPKETFIGILTDKRMEVIVTIIGIIKAGCVFVPLDTSYPGKRLKLMIETADIQVIIRNNSTHPDLITDGISREVRFLPLKGLVLEGDPQRFDRQPGIRYNPGDKIYIYFTSGTTGIPKAVVGKNTSLLQFIHWEIERFEIKTGLHFSQFVIPSFDPYLRDIFVPLCSGGTIHIPPGKAVLLDANKMVNWIETRGIQFIHCVPSLFRLINSASLTSGHFKGLKFILLSGEKINPSDLTRWYDIFDERIQLVNLYGPTETTLAKIHHLIRRTDINRVRIPIGQPIKGSRAIILDENTNICNTLIKGEICIRTAYSSYGYYNDPELNQKKFIQNPFSDDPGDVLYKTGDVGRFLADGNIDILGRMDRQVKIRGQRIEPEEIELLLIRHGAIKEAVVVKKEVSPGNESLYAYITAAPTEPGKGREGALVTADIKEYLSKNLPAFMVPAAIIKLEKIPRNSNQKIDYNKLPDPFVGEKALERRPPNIVEEKLLELWSDILGIEKSKISICTGFFESGGNSLNLMTLISKIHQAFDIRLTLGEIFNNPSIGKQAGIIINAQKEKYTFIKAAEEKQYYDLTSAQARMYVQQHLVIGDTSYNIPTVIRLIGKPDPERLRDTFKKLIQRHESLRTSFIMLQDKPVQQIHKDVEFEMEYYEAAEEKVKGIVTDFIRPFDLSKAPALRVGLIKTGEARHVLMVDMYHIISDVVSLGILVKDFMAIYNDEELPPLRIQYKDFAERQNRRYESGKIKEQEQYWLDQFKVELPGLNLPTDYPRPPVRRIDEGDFITFTLDINVVQELFKLVKVTDTTIFIFLLTVYNVLLFKYSGQEDIVVGSPITGRSHADLQNVIGVFINMLPIRNHPRQNKRFKDLLMEVKKNALEAFENQDYPFEELVNKLGLQGETSRNPLFDTEFAMNNIEIPGIEIPGLKLEPYDSENKFAKFDLHFLAIENNDTIIILLRYSTALFKPSTIEKLKDFYIEILEQVVEDLSIKLVDITISHELLAAASAIHSENTSDFVF